MSKKFFHSLFICFLTLAACESGHTPDVATHHSVEKEKPKNEKAETEQKPLSLEQKFLPPHFLVNQFTAKATSRSIELTIHYTISQQLYRLLEQYQDYYFVIQYPEELSRLTHVDRSNAVKGPLPANGLLSYAITMTSTWATDIPKDLIDRINHGDLRYNLVILDKERFPVHIFNDVQWYQSFDPNKGSSVMLEDGGAKK
ncbi:MULTISPECIES: hypothetical protein [Geobacillus]|uniref:Uncharacterized protein n=1 Tax=Geobacillus thermocatenulatus TaxID=33938 RepID=A0A226Q2H5_9BACL|nr:MULTISPECIES: hypothetical protein [Geobacillus]AST00153.1 hypothetical protein GT3921_14585 [Geobacillus thermocatenulatus]KLR72312.1 hypothetical protein ABH20_16885 [Geobacillus sp. T6]OXB86531.1 hypothetical protein B9L19_13455 [Geobacillus thermocatenulatus]